MRDTNFRHRTPRAYRLLLQANKEMRRLRATYGSLDGDWAYRHTHGHLRIALDSFGWKPHQLKTTMPRMRPALGLPLADTATRNA